MKPYTWRAAILRSDLQSTTRHVLLTLSCYINDVGQSAYPSIRALAEATGLTERAVGNHLRLARDAGWIRVAKHGFGGQRWANHEYFPQIPDADEYEEVDQGKKGEESSSSDEKGPERDSKGEERSSKGQEPNDKKDRNDVPTNKSIQQSKERTNKQRREQVAPDEFHPLQYLLDKGVERKVAKDWIKLRKGKGLAAIETAFEDVVEQAAVAGMTLHEVLKTCCVKGWGGFKAKWLLADRQSGAGSAWWATPETKLAKAIEVGAGNANPGESDQAWTARIQAAIDNGGRPPIPKQSAPSPASKVDEKPAGVSPELAAKRSAELKAALRRSA